MLSFQIESLSLGRGGLPSLLFLMPLSVKRNMSQLKRILARLRHTRNGRKRKTARIPWERERLCS